MRTYNLFGLRSPVIRVGTLDTWFFSFTSKIEVDKNGSFSIHALDGRANPTHSHFTKHAKEVLSAFRNDILKDMVFYELDPKRELAEDKPGDKRLRLVLSFTVLGERVMAIYRKGEKFAFWRTREPMLIFKDFSFVTRQFLKEYTEITQRLLRVKGPLTREMVFETLNTATTRKLIAHGYKNL